MKKVIDGGKMFDLLEDGEFFAASAEFEIGGNTILFHGTWNPTGDPDDEDLRATLEVLANESVTEKNYLDLGWDNWVVTISKPPF
jgi:hypothetical protein